MKLTVEMTQECPIGVAPTNLPVTFTLTMVSRFTSGNAQICKVIPGKGRDLLNRPLADLSPRPGTLKTTALKAMWFMGYEPIPGATAGLST